MQVFLQDFSGTHDVTVGLGGHDRDDVGRAHELWAGLRAHLVPWPPPPHMSERGTSLLSLLGCSGTCGLLLKSLLNFRLYK